MWSFKQLFGQVIKLHNCKQTEGNYLSLMFFPSSLAKKNQSSSIFRFSIFVGSYIRPELTIITIYIPIKGKQKELSKLELMIMKLTYRIKSLIIRCQYSSETETKNLSNPIYVIGMTWLTYMLILFVGTTLDIITLFFFSFLRHYHSNIKGHCMC